MKYAQYIAKKRFKGIAIGGTVNIPFGTVCDVRGDFIFYGDIKICAVSSFNSLEYFWGYDASNPTEEIERQRLACTLWDLVPKDDGDELLSEGNSWKKYGKLVEFTGRMCIWKWDEKIRDLPKTTLQHLIACVEKGTTPVCI